MEGKCPYSYNYKLLSIADETLSKYNSIIKNYKENKKKFVDPDFDSSRLNKTEKAHCIRLEDEYNDNIFENIREEGIIQGQYKDCFLISCLIQLTKHLDKIKELFVEPVNIESGCACLRFKCMDKPFYIIVDTLVPSNGTNLLYGRPATKTDSCWFCLVEKAYAKLMGGWEMLGGNSGDAMNVMFSCFSKTEKLKQIKKQPWERISEYLKETDIVFAAITTNEQCTQVGLDANHGYAVMGVDNVNNEQLIHLRDPHGYSHYSGPYSPNSKNWKPGQKEKVHFRDDSGHFWIPSSIFSKYFESIAYNVFLPKNWFSHSLEFDIEPGENDGRFFAGNGPYVGSLPQWTVTFPKKTTFKLYCVAASDSKNVLGLGMCLNNGNKISYKKLDEVQIKFAMDGSEIIDVCHADAANSPYTLSISRKQASTKPVHIFCKIESPIDFELKPIKEPDLTSLNHVTAKGMLNPGAQDGRSKFGNSSLDPVPQWNLKLTKPCRLYIIAHKDKSETEHTFFLAVPSSPGKYSKGGNFYQSILMAPNCTMEQDFIDIKDAKQYICVGFTREKSSKPTNFSFDIYSESPLELNPIEGTSTKHKGTTSHGFGSIGDPFAFMDDDNFKAPAAPPKKNPTKTTTTNKTSTKTSVSTTKTTHLQPKTVSKQTTKTTAASKPPQRQTSKGPTLATKPKARKTVAGELADMYKMLED